MPRDQEVPEAEEDLDRSLNRITTEEIGVIIKKLKPGEIAECKTKFMKRCLFIFVAYGVCWVCLCCHNPPNSVMDYRIFIVRTDVNACDCTRGCTDTERESALKDNPGKKTPNRTEESNLSRRRDGPMH